eukprot:Nitzschia sp. Nitz4//scaffold37_size175936//60473//63070//NITZ4_002040-RA/size175936-processed-gene-0.184-mRNA-1//1//CDS//3329549770//2973//frame0
MRWILLGLLSLIFQGIVDAVPCSSLTSQEECVPEVNGGEDIGCLWCPSDDGDTCVGKGECDSITGAPGCVAAESKDDCGDLDECRWCENLDRCIPDALSCSAQGNNSTQPCAQLDEEADCLASTLQCAWCGDVCRVSEAACGNSGVSVCNSISTQEECLFSEAGCLWCDDKCRQECEEDTVCVLLESEANCTATDCYWCDELDACTKNENVCDKAKENASCPSLEDQDSCTGVGHCFWCTQASVCKPNYKACPGNEEVAYKENICKPLTNETDCEDSGECVWCSNSTTCAASEMECPNEGRGNVCQTLAVEFCNTTDTCDWVESIDKCMGVRAAERIRDAQEKRDERFTKDQCAELATEANCTSQTVCRWCEDDSQCLKANERCSDGSSGNRGNPCPHLSNQTDCSSTSGCLWCDEAEVCTKDTNDACLETLGDALEYNCSRQDAEPDCEDLEGCQWCDAQSRCRLNATQCANPSGRPAVDLGDGHEGRFHIRDNGLGTTDPNSVSISLEYLYEIAEDGTTIESSLVDLGYLDFEYEQVVGTFFGDIEARKVSFSTDIEGVGMLVMDVYLILSNGTITLPGDTESWPVVVGDVKFNIKLTDWEFCDTSSLCGNVNETSAYIDMAFKITGSLADPEQDESNALMFDLGGNVPLLLSNLVVVDDSVQELPEGFPRVESTEDEGTVFVFRFPRFENAAEYDPVVPYSYSVIDVTDDAPTALPTATPTISPTAAPTKSPTPSPTASPTLAPTAAKKDGMSVGAIIGIVIAALLVCCCCCAVPAVLKKRAQEGSEVRDDDEPRGNEHMFHDEMGNVDKDTNDSDLEEESDNEEDSDEEEDDEEDEEESDEEEEEEDYEDDDDDDDDDGLV